MRNFLSLVCIQGGSMPHTSGQMYPSTIWGPTACATDKIADIELPELNVGDWLFFRNMGNYTVSAATNFNGFSKAFKHIYFASESKR